MTRFKVTFPGNIPLGSSLKNFLADKGMLKVASSVLHQIQLPGLMAENVISLMQTPLELKFSVESDTKIVVIEMNSV